MLHEFGMDTKMMNYSVFSKCGVCVLALDEVQHQIDDKRVQPNANMSEMA